MKELQYFKCFSKKNQSEECWHPSSAAGPKLQCQKAVLCCSSPQIIHLNLNPLSASQSCVIDPLLVLNRQTTCVAQQLMWHIDLIIQLLVKTTNVFLNSALINHTKRSYTWKFWEELLRKMVIKTVLVSNLLFASIFRFQIFWFVFWLYLILKACGKQS